MDKIDPDLLSMLAFLLGFGALCFTIFAPIYLLVGNSKWFRVICGLWTTIVIGIIFWFIAMELGSEVGGWDWNRIGIAIVGLIIWLLMGFIIFIKPIAVIFIAYKGHKYAKENEMYPHQEHEKRLREEERAEEEHQEYMRLLRAQRRYLEGNDRRLP